MSYHKIRIRKHILDPEFEFQINDIKEQIVLYYALIESTQEEILKVVDVVKNDLHKQISAD